MNTRLLFSAALSITSPVLSAADITWDTSATAGVQGGAGTWDNNSTTNWTIDGGATRQVWDNITNSVDTAVFGVSGGTVTVGGTLQLAGIRSSGNISGYNLTGGTLDFGTAQGNIDTSSLGTTGGSSFTIASNLTGNGGLTIAASGNLSASGGGSGTNLTLSGDNSGLSGGIAITAGVVNMTSQSALGANDLTLSNGGGLVAVVTPLSLSNNIHFSTTGGGTLRAYGSRVLTLTGALSGSGALSKTDGGTVELVNNNTGFAGDVSIGGGILRIGTGGTTGGLGSGNITNNSGLRINRSNAITLAQNISGSGSVINEGTGTTTFTGAVTTTGVIGVANNGTLVINNSSTNAGTTTGSDTNIDGSLQVQAGNVNARVLNFNSGSSSMSGGSITTTNNIRLGNSTTAAALNQSGGNLSVTGSLFAGDSSGSSGTHDLSGGQVSISGTYVLGTRGAATLSVSGNASLVVPTLWFGHNSVTTSTASGTLNLNGGVVQTNVIQKPGAQASTAILNFNGGTLRAGTDNFTFLTGITRANVRDGGAVIDTNGFEITLSQDLKVSNISGDAGTGGLTKTGAGTLLLNGLTEYKGDTVIDEGTLDMTFASLDDDSTVRIDLANGGNLFTFHGEMDTVKRLFIDGVQQEAGTYTNLETAAITGTGGLLVLEGPGSASPFDDWMTAFGFNPGDAGTAAGEDADDDGIDNLTEFALGGHPGNPSVRGIQALFTKDALGSDNLVLTVAVRSGAAFAGSPSPTAAVDGISYGIEGSTDLATWQTGAEEVSLVNPDSLLVAPDGYVLKSFRLIQVPALDARGFLRVRVAQP